MRNVFLILFMSFGIAGFSQETYCANPSPNNTNTSVALNFTPTLLPTTGWKYWTTNTITTTGTVNLTNNKLYSQTSVKLQSGFKATSTGNKIVIGVGSCSASSARSNERKAVKNTEEIETKLPDTNTVNIYPNPNNGNFTVNVGDFKSGVIVVEDMTGKVISQTSIDERSEYPFQLNEAAGVYLVRIINEEQILVKKILLN
jgi:hypothetical protein